MSIKDKYGTMMEEAFGLYYELFRKKGAVSGENAVTLEELFDGRKVSMPDKQMVRKMVSYCTVRKTGDGRYWLDEERAANPGNAMRRRLFLVLAALVLVLVYCSVVSNLKV